MGSEVQEASKIGIQKKKLEFLFLFDFFLMNKKEIKFTKIYDVVD